MFKENEGIIMRIISILLVLSFTTTSFADIVPKQGKSKIIVKEIGQGNEKEIAFIYKYEGVHEEVLGCKKSYSPYELKSQRWNDVFKVVGKGAGVLVMSVGTAFIGGMLEAIIHSKLRGTTGPVIPLFGMAIGFLGGVIIIPKVWKDMAPGRNMKNFRVLRKKLRTTKNYVVKSDVEVLKAKYVLDRTLNNICKDKDL
jgi:hypothetical protein